MGERKSMFIKLREPNGSLCVQQDQSLVSDIQETELTNLQVTAQQDVHKAQQVHLAMKYWGPAREWTDEQWNILQTHIEGGITGEELMRALDIPRRVSLDAIVHQLSIRKGELVTIPWETCGVCQQNKLRDLYTNSKGLSISNERLRRYGFDILAHTYVSMKKVGANQVLLTFDKD